MIGLLLVALALMAGGSKSKKKKKKRGFSTKPAHVKKTVADARELYQVYKDYKAG